MQGSLMPAQFHTHSSRGYFALVRPIPDLSLDVTGRSSEHLHKFFGIFMGGLHPRRNPPPSPVELLTPNILNSIKYLISLKVINIYHVLNPRSSDGGKNEEEKTFL